MLVTISMIINHTVKIKYFEQLSFIYGIWKIALRVHNSIVTVRRKKKTINHWGSINIMLKLI